MTAQRKQEPAATLGDVLYASADASASEEEWTALVQAIAAGDEGALHEFYGRTHRIVFTLMMRLTENREIAEDLTIDVFHDVWHRAAQFDGANDAVLGWLMNRARNLALERRRRDSRTRREVSDGALGSAVAALAPGERQAIETTFFAGLTHVEAAERLNQPVDAVMTRLRSGLHKLRDALAPKRESHDHV